MVLHRNSLVYRYKISEGTQLQFSPGGLPPSINIIFVVEEWYEVGLYLDFTILIVLL